MISFNELKDLFEKLKSSDFDDVNIFDAVGMTTQETKHSAFFAWLLSPKKPHGFSTYVLEEFLIRLYNYNTKTPSDIIPANTVPFSNKAIINRNLSISKKEDLIDIVTKCNLNEIKVRPEYPTDIPDANKGKRRIDILIDIPIAWKETVIVIENKVGATLSKDQLKDYYEYICLRSEEYKNYPNKIFIYLNPKGDVPTDSDGVYDGKWCVFGYLEICNVIKYIARNTKGKLKELMEDYCDMVSKVILNADQKWQLVSGYSENIVELYECLQNKRANLEYCRTWLKKNVAGYIEDNVSDSSFNFHTKAIENCFKRHNEKYEYLKCTWFCGSNSGIDGVLKIYKDCGLKTTIIDAYKNYNVKTKQNSQPTIKKTYDLISDNDIWLMPLSDIQYDLDRNLKSFKQAIDIFDSIISKL